MLGDGLGGSTNDMQSIKTIPMAFVRELWTTWPKAKLLAWLTLLIFAVMC